MANKTILFFFITLFSSLTYSQEYYGVYFKSKEVGKESRTGIDITKKGLINYDKSFTISFDLSYRNNPHRYGHILQLKESKENNNLDLILQVEDLILVHNKKTQIIKLQIPENYREQFNTWHEIKIHYSGSENKIHIAFDDKIVNAPLKLPESAEYALTFGVVNNYGFDPVEVPPVTIKEIEIFSNNKEQYHWPLKKHQGNIEKDLINKKEIDIINPDWEVNHHKTWVKQITHTFESKVIPQIAYDSVSEVIYFLLDKQTISKYYLQTNKFENLEYFGIPLYEEAQQVIVDHNGKLTSYSFNNPGLSQFDEKNNSWNNTKSFKTEYPNYWHHNKLIHPYSKKTTILNGYGFYLYKNSIQTFNSKTKYWENLNFSGDTIYPRYLSSLSNSSKNGIYYLFGGLGNQNGKQILGLEFYYDLYAIDFNSNKITRIWKLNQSPFNKNFTPVNSLVTDKKCNCFYTLVFPHEQYNTYLRIAKSTLKQPDFEWIGDSIPYQFKDIESFADLYFWKSRNSLLAITLHKEGNNQYVFNSYTLKFPPIDKQIEVNTGLDTKLLLIVFGSLLVIIIPLLIFMRFKNAIAVNKNEEIKKISLTNPEKTEENTPKNNSILLFGGFEVFDKSGRNITYRFSPTLKELFLLILLNSKEKGISSLKIQEFLWPDKNEEKAKNNRGVNIKKLRELLTDIEGIELVYDNTYWKLNLEDNIYCDYFQVYKLLSDYDNNISQIHKNILVVLHLLKKGAFLYNTNNEWVDHFKEKVSHVIIEYLENQIQLLNGAKQFNHTIEIANVIFSFDQINELALKYKVKALSAQGHHSLAFDTYNKFSLLYNELYSEDFSIPFKKLLK